MGIGKSLARILAPVAVVGALAFGNVQEAKADNLYLYGDVGIDFFAGTEFARVKSTPEYIRDVPAHPDDLHKVNSKNVAPLSDGELIEYAHGADVIGKVGLGIEKELFNFKCGIQGGVSTLFPSLVERNYTNHPGTDKRGDRAALTFYEIGIDILSFGINAEVSKDLTDELSIFLDYFCNFIPHELNLTNGWDRYNSFEVKDEYKLADLPFCSTIKFGGRFNGMSIFVGAKSFPFAKMTPLAEETGLTIKPISFFIGCGAEINLLKFPEDD
jgi:hypothetical protein